MSNALARLEPKDLKEANWVAGIFAQSGMFQDTRQAAQALVKIMAGREVGIGAFASMQGVHMIDGKPTYSANLMAAAVKRSDKYDYRVKTLTNTVCVIIFLEHGEVIGESEFTMGEADRLGLNKTSKGIKTNWEKFPRNMLFARALSNGVRWYCPDVFDMPVYTPDEFDADEPIEGELVIIEPDGNDTPPNDDPPAEPEVSEDPAPDEPEPPATPKGTRKSKPAPASLASEDAEPPDDVSNQGGAIPVGLDDLCADTTPFSAALWLKYRPAFINAGLAANDFEANGRMAKVVKELGDDITVGQLAQGFQARASASK